MAAVKPFDVDDCRVLARRLLIAIEADFCAPVPPEAASRWSAPEIVDADQGGQFGCAEFVAKLARIGATQGMGDKCRWRDTVLIEGL